MLDCPQCSSQLALFRNLTAPGWGWGAEAYLDLALIFLLFLLSLRILFFLHLALITLCLREDCLKQNLRRQ